VQKASSTVIIGRAATITCHELEAQPHQNEP